MNFFFQQGCIIDTCKSELMLDFGLAPCNFATFHLDLIFHTTCVQKIAPSMQTNARQKKKECPTYIYIYPLKFLSQLEWEVQISHF